MAEPEGASLRLGRCERSGTCPKEPLTTDQLFFENCTVTMSVSLASGGGKFKKCVEKDFLKETGGERDGHNKNH